MKSLNYLQTLFESSTVINQESVEKEVNPPLPEIQKIYPGKNTHHYNYFYY